ncbi:MAG TPA: biotin--[acetyl-CoA-carboxylase] ligase, partial [Gammaproteobacteria bacterium]|nr:biotin--[acetyl-CoA-carboxylase] ligase [Gammaproteobacteria bacterium]
MTAERLLHALADGRTHSGEELARAFGITRAAVWKQVGKLADWGLTVEAAPGAGYRLPRRLDLLDSDALRAALTPEVAARVAKLEVFTELGSTNRHLLATPPRAGELDVCIAEYQTAGRGRRGRRWSVPLGGGICLSVGWQFADMPADLAALTLAVGVVARRVLQRVAGLEIELKWPNDLVFDDRKLGGILLELAGEAQGGAHVVAGIGLNVALPPELLPSLSDWPRGAIDIATALGRGPPPRAALAGALINELAELFEDYPRHGFAAYRSEWRAGDY